MSAAGDLVVNVGVKGTEQCGLIREAEMCPQTDCYLAVLTHQLLLYKSDGMFSPKTMPSAYAS